MPFDSMLPIVAWAGYVACLVYLTVLTVIFAALARMAVRENRDRAGDAAVEDFSIVRSSPFTIPVSVVAPAYNEEVCITASIRSLLALDYP